jgi:hypothetical protein
MFGSMGANPSGLVYSNANDPVQAGMYGSAGHVGTSQSRSYRNGAQNGSGATTVEFVNSTNSVHVFARNTYGTAGGFCPCPMGAYFITNGLSEAEISSLYTATHALMQALGRVA